MPTYERCNVTTGSNARGFAYRCNKKVGHVDRGDTEHADSKNVPVYRWKDSKETSN
jgi:hypothetical protein